MGIPNCLTITQEETAHWLAIGPSENWEIGDKVEPGDTVFFYVTAPVKGLIGYGTVEKTGASGRRRRRKVTLSGLARSFFPT